MEIAMSKGRIVYEKEEDRITIKDGGIEITIGNVTSWMCFSRFIDDYKDTLTLKILAKKAGYLASKMDGEA